MTEPIIQPHLSTALLNEGCPPQHCLHALAHDFPELSQEALCDLYRNARIPNSGHPEMAHIWEQKVRELVYLKSLEDSWLAAAEGSRVAKDPKARWVSWQKSNGYRTAIVTEWVKGTDVVIGTIQDLDPLNGKECWVMLSPVKGTAKAVEVNTFPPEMLPTAVEETSVINEMCGAIKLLRNPAIAEAVAKTIKG